MREGGRWTPRTGLDSVANVKIPAHVENWSLVVQPVPNDWATSAQKHSNPVHISTVCFQNYSAIYVCLHNLHPYIFPTKIVGAFYSLPYKMILFHCNVKLNSILAIW
jgi:hypothetical protein